MFDMAVPKRRATREWTILRNDHSVTREATFPRAKQTVRALRRADPNAAWTVADPTGRIVIRLEAPR